MDHIKLLKDKIDINFIQNILTDESCGATSIFIGMTRDNFDGKKVISLEYEAYENMATKEIGKICSELRLRWPNVKNIAIYHRLGIVPVSEESVVIAVSAPHRAAALESVSFAVDQLKSRVPIWKKEIYETDSIGIWKENMECSWPPSLRNFDFSSCEIDQTIENIPNKLVQIKVDDKELNNRVECFLKRKRDEINFYNITDFKDISTGFKNQQTIENNSCARTQSVLVKQQQSSGHLKVRRADNRNGPQIQSNYLMQLNKLMTQRCSHNTAMHTTLQNARLQNIEEYMCVTSDDDNNVISRIKKIEDRILLIESTSPEYNYFAQHVTGLDKSYLKKAKNETYLLSELNDYIVKLMGECEKKVFEPK